MASAPSAAQQKFTSLRRRLDQLGYKQPLGIESLPLVERLFADLLHTTESLKQPITVPTDTSGIESQVDAYRSDNAKLVKENNDLHQQLIKITEKGEFSLKDTRASLRKLEHENADLKFLNNQYMHKIRTLERESKAKSDKMMQLQEKNFHAVVQTPGGRKKHIPFRRQRMEVDCELPPSGSRGPRIARCDDPYVADLLKMADEKVEAVTLENRLLEEEKEGQQGKIDRLTKQLDTRDVEIERLSGLLEGGRPFNLVELDSKNRKNERLIAHLNIQIDFLQQKNSELQLALDRSLVNARRTTEDNLDLDKANVTLEKEVQEEKITAHRAQQDKEEVLRAADRELREAKNELEKSRAELETMDQQIAGYRQEKEDLMTTVSELRVAFSSEQTDRSRLEDLIDKIQEDKRKLGARVSKLTANERELVLEIDRLKHRNGPKGKKSSRAVEAFMRGLEEERDYWRSEVDVLQKLLHTKNGGVVRAGARTSSRASSPTRSRSVSPTRSRGSKAEKQLENHLMTLEKERDHYKREVELLRASRTSRSSSPIRISPSATATDDVIRLQRERDELKSLLNKFEIHMGEIQNNVKALTCERDQLNQLYEDTKVELGRLRMEAVRQPRSPKSSLTAQAVLRRVENERDDAVNDLRRATAEKESLRDRMKIATENHLSDRAKLERDLEDLEHRLHLLSVERGDDSTRVAALQKEVLDLEAQLRLQGDELRAAHDAAQKQRASADHMRMLADQGQRAVEDAQSRLVAGEADLRTARESAQLLDERISSLTRARAADEEEIARLRAAVTRLDQERDDLQISSQEKGESLTTLERDLRAREQSCSDYRIRLDEMEMALGVQRDAMTGREHEVTTLRRKLESVTSELAEVTRAREVALRENRRLQEDLATMTRENQALNADLSECLEEKDALKIQTQDYISEVKRIEEVMAGKEHERAALLDQYQALSVENETVLTQAHQLESEGSNLRLEIRNKDGEARRLRERNELLERESTEHLNAERAFDKQVSELSRRAAQLEEAVRLLEDEKHCALQDLSAVRDLCARLEANKDQLQRQLTTKSLDHEQLQNLLDDMKAETGLLRGQVTKEKGSVESLRGLLQNNREKEIHVQMGLNQKEKELDLLRDRLSISETKADAKGRELEETRKNLISLETEVRRLERAVANERFERERAVQELRRHNILPPGDSSGRLSRLGAGSPVSPAPRATSGAPRAVSPARAGSLRGSPFHAQEDEAYGGASHNTYYSY